MATAVYAACIGHTTTKWRYTVASSRYNNAFDLLATPADKGTSDALTRQIQGAKTKRENFRSLIKSFAKALFVVNETQVDPEFLGVSMNNNRKMANRLAIVHACPEAETLWADEVAKGKAYRAAHPDSKGALPAGQGTEDPYYVFLAKGTEARARMWEMTRMMEKGASQEEVFFIHEGTVEEYRKAKWAYETAVALQKSL